MRITGIEDGYNFKQLQQVILALSEATDWEIARKEWSLVDIHEADEPETCVCGHNPIREICQIRNRVTKQSADVGNRCVKRFLGIRSDLIFTGLKRIRKDLTKSLNADAIAFFRERGLFDEREYDFLQHTMRKRILTPKQSAWRERINQRVLAAVEKRGFQGPS